MNTTRPITRRQAAALVGASALPLLFGSSVRAADWPTRSVTIFCPFAAGGNTDMMARIGAQRLTEKFGQSFIVENRPSAGGALAAGQVAAAEPDGYTLLFTASSVLFLTPKVQKVTYDPDKQFVPITNVGTGTQMIAIRRDLPATNLAEFLAYAKANPGKLNYVAAGTQNISHLGPALMFARAGVDVVMIPAKGGPQAVSDLMAGQVDLYFGNTSELLVHKNSDKIRLIAVATEHRLDIAPDIPSASETLPGLAFSSWNGFLAPAGTPDAIVTALRSELTALAKSPETAARLNNLGIVPGGLTLEQTTKVFENDKKVFTEGIKAAGFSAEPK
jgi:tripartite-type tricarboxylate transporter receptor subunit TctC